MRRTLRAAGLALLTLLCGALSVTRAAAQPPPPIQGVTGTIATEGTINDEHAAGHKVAEGAAHAVDAVKRTFSRGGKGASQNPLDALIEGSRVVVRDAAASEGGPTATTEGVVVDVNRSRRQITVRLADKTTQVLRVMDGTASQSSAGAHVVVSLADQADAIG